jgi:hydroxyacylglutathione hydrolase
MRLRALHTPGHTPESMCYALFVSDAPERAWGIFTGDTLFIGESGRTDLPDPSRTGENAGLLYDGVREKLLPLGDQALIFPAHGSGSVCGGNIAERDDSTLGLERAYNPVFNMTREAFIAAKIKERIPRPPYFANMEKLNRKGGIPLQGKAGDVKLLQPKQFASEKEQGIVIDARDPEAFAAGHIPHSLSIWASGLPVFGGWIADPATRVYLVVPGADEIENAVLSLARIGLDRIDAVLAGGFDAWRDAGLPVADSGAIAPRELKSNLQTVRVLDVRDDMEFEDEGHIRGASHMYVGYLNEHLSEIVPPLDKSERIAVACSVGHRASLAVSILRRNGFAHVDNILGGMTAWSKLGFPLERNAENTVSTPQIEGERT